MNTRILTKDLVSDTLEIMRLLERTEEIGDCVIWQGYVGTTGHPMVRRNGKTLLVRREVYQMSGWELIPRQPIDTRCGEKCCINPAHLYPSTIAAIAKKAAKGGAWKSLARSAKISAKKRTNAKLTIEQAREIRVSDESGPVLSARYGVDRSLINGIKAGKIWRDYSNPFNQLMRLGA